MASRPGSLSKAESMSRLMIWFGGLSLARKLTAIGVATSAAALVLACIVIGTLDVETSSARIVRDTTLLADVVGANSAAALAVDDPRGAAEILSAVGMNERIVTAAILLR